VNDSPASSWSLSERSIDVTNGVYAPARKPSLPAMDVGVNPVVQASFTEKLSNAVVGGPESGNP
jgi:hypothetical protein